MEASGLSAKAAWPDEKEALRQSSDLQPKTSSWKSPLKMLLYAIAITAALLTLSNSFSHSHIHKVPHVHGSLPSCGLTDRFPLQTAPDWSHVKIAGGLHKPRGLAVDSAGNLLVIENGKGVTALTLGRNGCVASSKNVISNPALNHGIALSPDGKSLIVSSAVHAWRYAYDAATQTVADETVIVHGMSEGGHVSRTVAIPPATPNLLIVSHGSVNNMDFESADPAVGRSIVKVFDLDELPEGGFDYASEGWNLGYGLRNDVVIAVDNDNKVWGVENSADNFARVEGGEVTDIHNGNPAEEMNFLGDPSMPNNNWYGYPTCFTVWDGSLFPHGNPPTGSEFVLAPNGSVSDSLCREKSTPPRLSIESHTAPIDGQFNADCSSLLLTLHGSWNSARPTGYKVIEVPFKENTDRSGNRVRFEPVAERDSREGYRDVLWDTQEGCTSRTCLRPSGLVFSLDFGRVYFASDGDEGEVFVLMRTG